ncbi:hypothetical protein EJB05_07384, partial [Eragrostis curvula]
MPEFSLSAAPRRRGGRRPPDGSEEQLRELEGAAKPKRGSGCRVSSPLLFEVSSLLPLQAAFPARVAPQLAGLRVLQLVLRAPPDLRGYCDVPGPEKICSDSSSVAFLVYSILLSTESIMLFRHIFCISNCPWV